MCDYLFVGAMGIALLKSVCLCRSAIYTAEIENYSNAQKL